uniref:Uncharacterized protein n=1 Tax=Arion vulgaris TaxID=1028688 RepID=A0A0B7AGF5_9EUPU
MQTSVRRTIPGTQTTPELIADECKKKKNWFRSTKFCEPQEGVSLLFNDQKQLLLPERMINNS